MIDNLIYIKWLAYSWKKESTNNNDHQPAVDTLETTPATIISTDNMLLMTPTACSVFFRIILVHCTIITYFTTAFSPTRKRK